MCNENKLEGAALPPPLFALGFIVVTAGAIALKVNVYSGMCWVSLALYPAFYALEVQLSVEASKGKTKQENSNQL